MLRLLGVIAIIFLWGCEDRSKPVSAERKRQERLASYSFERVFVEKSWRIVGREDVHTFLPGGVGTRITTGGAKDKFQWRVADFENAVHIKGSGVPKIFRFKTNRLGTMTIPGDPRGARAIELVG